MARFTSKVSASTPFGSANNEEILSYVCVAVIGLFVVIAKPENTATFFSHPAVKALLFVIVAAVVYADVKVGVLFGIAVTLTFVYSHVMASQVAERFYAAGDDATTDEAPPVPKTPCEGNGDGQCVEGQTCTDGYCEDDEDDDDDDDEDACPTEKTCKHDGEGNDTMFAKQKQVDGACKCPDGSTDTSQEAQAVATTPAAETTTPAAETTTPAAETTTPATETTTPAAGADGTAEPAASFTNFTPEAYAAVENFAPYYH